jgi:hypothetical protein
MNDILEPMRELSLLPWYETAKQPPRLLETIWGLFEAYSSLILVQCFRSITGYRAHAYHFFPEISSCDWVLLGEPVLWTVPPIIKSDSISRMSYSRLPVFGFQSVPLNSDRCTLALQVLAAKPALVTQRLLEHLFDEGKIGAEDLQDNMVNWFVNRQGVWVRFSDGRELHIEPTLIELTEDPVCPV